MTSLSKADPREGAPHPWLYFALVQLLSIPFYWGVLTPIQGFPFYGWPAVVAVIFAPATVATILTAREQGGRAALRLWGRVGDVMRIRGPGWVLFAHPGAAAGVKRTTAGSGR